MFRLLSTGVITIIFTMSCAAIPNKALEHLKQLQKKSALLIKSTQLDLLSCLSGACCMGAILICVSAVRQRKLSYKIDQFIRQVRAPTVSELTTHSVESEQMPELENISTIVMQSCQDSRTDELVVALTKFVEAVNIKKEMVEEVSHNQYSTITTPLIELPQLFHQHSNDINEEDQDALIQAEIEQKLREEEARKNNVE